MRLALAAYERTRLGEAMYKTLQSAHGRLLLILRIGPLFRISVLTWRAIFGGQTGRRMTPSVPQDPLSLTIAAVDGLRHDVAARNSA
jgi:hypothetical protein